MQDSVEVTAMVVSSMPVGEADRRIVLISRELGRITVFARGARKPTSRFVGCTKMFAFGKFEVFPGKEAFNLQKADISEYFDALMPDVEGTAYGCYFCELASCFIRENQDGSEILALLWYALKALQNQHIPNALVQRIMELRLLSIYGVLPDFSACSHCRKTTETGVFLPDRMQLVCEECRGDKKGYELDAASLYMLRYVAASDIRKLFTFNVSPEVLRTVSKLTGFLRERFVDRELKSLQILEMLKNDE